MKYFYVIPNWAKDPSGEAANEIKAYLEGKGCVCGIRSDHAGNLGSAGLPSDKTGQSSCEYFQPQEQNFKYTNPAEVPKDTQCVIVLGGDGTLIQATRDLVDLGIPFVGVNLGTLGYLAELEIQSIKESLDSLVEDKFVVQERMMLSGSLIRDGRVLEENIALNEVVVGRGCALNVIRFSVSVNGRFLNSYAADGVIMGTPTGSTGYNLSAGGPILEPDASMILLTPISPHSMINRSIVLADTAEVEIEITKVGVGGAILAFDGNGSMTGLKNGDRLRIRKSDKKTKILTLSKESFLEILRNKMSGE